MARTFLLTAQTKLLPPSVANVNNVLDGINARVNAKLGKGVSLRVNINTRDVNTITRNLGKLEQKVKSFASVQNKDLNRTIRVRVEGTRQVQFLTSAVNKAIERVGVLNQLLKRNSTFAIQVGGLKNIEQFRRQLAGIKAEIRSIPPLRINTKTIESAAAATDRLNKSAGKSVTTFEQFGRRLGSTVRNLSSFIVAYGAFASISSKINSSFADALGFEKQLTTIAQVTDRSVASLSSFQKAAEKAGSAYGVLSSELVEGATIFAQAGLSLKEIETLLPGLARIRLAPSFDLTSENVEASIAILNQFGKEASQLEDVFASVNEVSAKYAVEAQDIFTAVKRGGGAFAAAGGELNEFIAAVTTIRQTTRESAEAIGTSFRTLAGNIQRTRVADFLKDSLGVNIRDAEGNFVGFAKAFKEISSALRDVPTESPVFSEVVEQLAGVRQSSRVIPLLKNFELFEKVLKTSNSAGQSLAADVVPALDTLSNQINKLQEDFTQLIRAISQDKVFRALAEGSILFARALIQITDAIRPLIPLVTAFAAVKFKSKILSAPGEIAKGFKNQLFSTKVFGRNKGGIVPGGGPNKDTVSTMLTPGEFVLRRDAVQRIGVDRLKAMNSGRGYNRGGLIRGGAAVAGLAAGGSFLNDTSTGIQQKMASGQALTGFESMVKSITGGGQEVGDLFNDLATNLSQFGTIVLAANFLMKKFAADTKKADADISTIGNSVVPNMTAAATESIGLPSQSAKLKRRRPPGFGRKLGRPLRNLDSTYATVSPSDEYFKNFSGPQAPLKSGKFGSSFTRGTDLSFGTRNVDPSRSFFGQAGSLREVDATGVAERYESARNARLAANRGRTTRSQVGFDLSEVSDPTANKFRAQRRERFLRAQRNRKPDFFELPETFGNSASVDADIRNPYLSTKPTRGARIGRGLAGVGKGLLNPNVLQLAGVVGSTALSSVGRSFNRDSIEKGNGISTTGLALGASSKAVGGAATGAALGSVVPVIGTAFGALIGGIGGLATEIKPVNDLLRFASLGFIDIKTSSEEAAIALSNFNIGQLQDRLQSTFNTEVFNKGATRNQDAATIGSRFDVVEGINQAFKDPNISEENKQGLTDSRNAAVQKLLPQINKFASVNNIGFDGALKELGISVKDLEPALKDLGLSTNILRKSYDEQQKTVQTANTIAQQSLKNSLASQSLQNAGGLASRATDRVLGSSTAFSGGGVRSSSLSELLDAASNGGISSTESKSLNAQLKQLTKLGGPLPQLVGSSLGEITAGNQIAPFLGKNLNNLGDSEGLAADFKKVLKDTGLNDTVAGEQAARLEQIISGMLPQNSDSADAVGLSNNASSIEKIINEFTSGTGQSTEALKLFSETMEKQAEKIDGAFNQIRELESSITDRRLSGNQVGLNRARFLQDANQSGTLPTSFFRGLDKANLSAINPGATNTAGQLSFQALNARQELANLANQAPSIERSDSVNYFTRELEKATQGLQYLATESNELVGIQEKLAELERQRSGQRDLAFTLATGSKQDVRQSLTGLSLAQQINSGSLSQEAFGQLNTQQRQSALSTGRQLFDPKKFEDSFLKLAGFGNLTKLSPEQQGLVNQGQGVFNQQQAANNGLIANDQAQIGVLNEAINSLKTALPEALKSAFATFDSSTKALADAIGRFPSKVDLNVNYTKPIEVIVNGNEVWRNMQQPLANVIEKEITKAIDNLKRDLNVPRR